MRHLVVLLMLLMCATAHAQTTALIDANGSVLSLPAPDTVPQGCVTVNVTDASAFGQTDSLEDDYGRQQWRVTSKTLVRRQVAIWAHANAVDFNYKARATKALDTLILREVALERWQADYSATLNRQAELDAVRARLTAVINILNGP